MRPSWSPDGRRIAYDGFSLGIVVADADGANPRRITPDGVYPNEPVWSPNAEVIAFEARYPGGGGLSDTPSDGATHGVEDSDIFLVGADGTNLRRIVNGGGHESHPRFSEDGTRVIFHRLGTGPGGLIGEGEDSGWYSVALDGSDERRLTVGLPPLPHYSPDGRFLAVVTAYDDLYTMRADGSDVRHWPGYAGTVTWAPEGPTLYVERGYIDRIDFSGRAPVISRLIRTGGLLNGGIDWTGRTPLAPPDIRPPATVLLGAKQRPLGIAPAGAARIAARRRVPAVARGALRFYAVDATGVSRVEASLGRMGRSGRCRFLGTRSFSRPRSCAKPLFRQVRSDAGWRRRARRLKRGTYRIGFRTVDISGNRTRRPRFTMIRVR